MLHVSNTALQEKQAKLSVVVNFRCSGVKALTQIHQLPAAMSRLLGCEGLLHPGLVVCLSLECFRVLELCYGIPNVF